MDIGKNFISDMCCKLAVVVGAMLMFASCSFLDVEPQDLIEYDKFFKNEEELEMALTGCYRQLASNDLYGDMFQGRMGLTADLGYCTQSTDMNTVAFNTITVSDAKILGYWKRLYVVISRANLLLKNVDKVDMDVTRRGYIKGEALFLRAYAYFLLVNKFRNIPLILDVPPTSDPEYLQVAQSSPETVYRKIVADMKEAGDLVRPISAVEGGGHVTQSAVWGILARVCLTMAGEPLRITEMYAEAETYAKKVIDTGLHRLNPKYDSIFINYSRDIYDPKESIFEIEYWGDNTGLYYTAGRVGRNTGIASSVNSPIGQCIAIIRATDFAYHLYDRDDLRRDWCIGNFTYVNNSDQKNYMAEGSNMWIRYCGKFRREYEVSSSKAGMATAINFPVLRYADVLLMYAEAHLCNPERDRGQDDAALEYFNMVRRRGHGADVDVPGEFDYEWVSDTEFMNEIRDERARELAYELLRRDDLVRWGMYNDQMRYIHSTVPSSMVWEKYANAYFGNVSARDVVWPIPAYEIGVNKKLVQNTGW